MTVTSEQLNALIVSAIAAQIDIGRKPIDAIVTLSPACIQAVIDKKLIIPLEVNSVPVHISEAPAKVNKPSGRYMINCMVSHQAARGRRGKLFLGEVAE